MKSEWLTMLSDKFLREGIKRLKKNQVKWLMFDIFQVTDKAESDYVWIFCMNWEI